MNRSQIIILWAAAILACFFLVHPRFVAQMHTDAGWIPLTNMPDTQAAQIYHPQGAWIWSPPDDRFAVIRYQPDRGRQLAYLLGTLILGAAAFVTAPYLSRDPSNAIAHLPSPIAPDAPHVQELRLLSAEAQRTARLRK